MNRIVNNSFAMYFKTKVFVCKASTLLANFVFQKTNKRVPFPGERNKRLVIPIEGAFKISPLSFCLATRDHFSVQALCATSVQKTWTIGRSRIHKTSPSSRHRTLSSTFLLRQLDFSLLQLNRIRASCALAPWVWAKWLTAPQVGGRGRLMTMDALGAHPTTEPAPVADSVLFFIRLGKRRAWLEKRWGVCQREFTSFVNVELKRHWLRIARAR